MFWSVWRHLLRHSPDSDSGVSTEWHPFQEYKCSGTRREAQGAKYSLGLTQQLQVSLLVRGLQTLISLFQSNISCEYCI